MGEGDCTTLAAHPISNAIEGDGVETLCDDALGKNVSGTVAR
jgi:hypothetical protein